MFLLIRAFVYADVPNSRKQSFTTLIGSRLWIKFRGRISFREGLLMPVRVGTSCRACSVEPPDVFTRQAPADHLDIVYKLRLAAHTYDEARNCGPLKQPVQRNLHLTSAGLACDSGQLSDDSAQYPLVHRRNIMWRGVVRPTSATPIRFRAKTPPPKWAPHQRLDALVDA